MKNAPATPLPWSMRTEGGDTYIDSKDAHRTVACDMQYYPWIETADMPYIVHAANAYPRLVAALREYVDVVASVNHPNTFNVTVKDEGHHARDLLIELGEAH